MINEPIRILCVFSSLDRGGAESMCMNLYRQIDKDKIQFDFVKHTERECAFDREILALGGRIYVAPRLTIKTLVKYIYWWKNHFKKHKEHQIVHGHFFTISPIYFMIAHRFNRFTIGHVHASKSDGFLKEVLVRQIEKHADFCIACSDIAGKWAYPHRRFLVIKNAVDMSNYRYSKKVRDTYREQLGLQDKYVLGTVANFSMVKNPIGLIRIFSYVHQLNPKSRLLWIGDGNMRKMIEQEKKKLSLDKEIILLGSRSDVPDLLQAMDCFLLPSFNEGLPVSVIEAQASDLPCFLSDTITRETDITGNCRFIDIENTEAWGEAILSTKHKRRDLTPFIEKAGYEIHDSAKKMEKLYMRISEICYRS